MENGAFDPMGVGPRGDPGVAIGVQSWERTYTTILHLTNLLTMTGLPIIPALIMWLIKREDSVFVDDHGKEAVNFQISMLIYVASGFVLMVCPPVAILLWSAVGVLSLVGSILAAVAANHGRYYRYPATMRLLK